MCCSLFNASFRGRNKAFDPFPPLSANFEDFPKKAGKKKLVGLKTWPHGLRHAAITEALDLTGGDVRKVQRFSRHRDLQTLTIYDDNRVDLAGEVSKLVASNGGTREDGTAL